MTCWNPSVSPVSISKIGEVLASCPMTLQPSVAKVVISEPSAHSGSEKIVTSMFSWAMLVATTLCAMLTATHQSSSVSEPPM